MIDFKNWENVNEYDRIILNWEEQDNVPPMKYVVVEDLKNKCWIVYDSSTGLYREMPFGKYTQVVINEFLNYDKNSVHHSKLLEMAQQYDFEYDKETKHNLFVRCQKAIKQLLELLSNLSEYRKLAKKGVLIDNSGNHITPEMLENILMNEWKRYRYTCFSSMWQNYVDLEFSDIEDAEELKKRFSFIENTSEEILGEWKEEGKEINESHHRFIRDSLVCYYDYIIFVDKDGNSRAGRCFVTSDEIYMYCWDLFHILVSRKAETPHICPRCNQLFFSNNNKAIYCEDCKAESNIVRNENRMKSVRYIHKKIYDKINNSKFYDDMEKELFLAESNYYWDIVKGKQVKKLPLFTAKIETEADYRKWLEEKLQSI